jgi:suppressor of ftsI
LNVSRISRRKVVVGGAATAAALSTLSLEACRGVTVPSTANSPFNFVLPVQYATSVIGGKSVRARTYSGTIPGPTIYAAPGYPLNITVTNQLPADPPVPLPSPPIDPLNNPHLFNTTNLHVHGLQVAPHIFDPIGTTNPAAPMIAIAPGKSYTYGFTLPSDHPSGLYWYHPHHHGSTDTEVSGGMAGLIIVRGPIDNVPEIAAARDIPIAVPGLQLNPDPTVPGGYCVEYNAYQQPQNGGYTPRSQFIFMLVNGQLVNVISGLSQGTQVFSSTPYPPPQFQMQPGEVVRLRFLNGTNSLNLPLQLAGFEVYLIGIDGVNLLAPQRIDQSGNNSVFTTAATRVEMLVRAPSTPGTYTMSSLPITDPNPPPNGHNWPLLVLLQITVAGAPVAMGIPSSLPTPSREYPLIADSEIVGNRSIVFNGVGPSNSIIAGTNLTVNGQAYNEFGTLFSTSVGTAEQWTVSNQMTEGHPFHMHTNSFEVHSVSGPTGTTTYNPPYIADTVWIPPSGQAVLRTRYKQWRGKDVFHCHKLAHEDQGMMANVMLS